MAKANLVLANGTKVMIQGTPEEVAILLSRCSQAGEPSPLDATPGHSRRKNRGRSTNAPPKKKSGPTLYITELVAEQYFKSKRTLGDIQKKLEERGHIYAQTSLSPVLTRLTRRRDLRRIKEKKGWVYVL